MPSERFQSDSDQIVNEHPGLRLFAAHGIEFHKVTLTDGGPEATATCFNCERPKLHVNAKSQLWHCKTCESQGNLTQFLESRAAEYEKGLTVPLRRQLARTWALPASALVGAGIGWNGENFTITIRDYYGNVVNIRRYRGRTLLNTPGCGAALYGAERFREKPNAIVYVCEGEKDAIALRYLLKRAGKEGVTVAVPGAGIFKREWTRWFEGRQIVALYDNDEAGAKGEHRLLDRIESIAKSVQFLRWPDDDEISEGFDIRDWITSRLGSGKSETAILREIESLLTEEPRIPRSGSKIRAEGGCLNDLHRVDIATAKRFVRLFSDRVIWVPQHKSWYVYDGIRWKADIKGEVQKLAAEVGREIDKEVTQAEIDHVRKELRQLARRAGTRRGIDDMLAVAKPHVARELDELDADLMLLNCPNGTLDLRTMELRSHDPADLITKVSKASYIENADSRLWNDTITRLLPNAKIRRYVQRYAGLSLTGEQLKSFVFVYGPRDSGKSTVLEALYWVLGEYAAVTDPRAFTVKRFENPNTPELAKLPGVRAVFVAELSRGQTFDAAGLKRWTGGDTVQATAKHKAPFEFRPQGSLWFAANERPKIPYDDEGMWRRVNLVPFDEQIPRRDQDPLLGEKLRESEHASAILAWAVKGWGEIQKAGMKLRPPKSVRLATKGYRKEMDPLGVFIEEHCVREEDAFAIVDELYERYAICMEAEGVRERMTRSDFSKALGQRGFTAGRRRAEFRRVRKQRRVRLGIKLLPL